MDNLLRNILLLQSFILLSQPLTAISIPFSKGAYHSETYICKDQHYITDSSIWLKDWDLNLLLKSIVDEEYIKVSSLKEILSFNQTRNRNDEHEDESFFDFIIISKERSIPIGGVTFYFDRNQLYLNYLSVSLQYRSKKTIDKATDGFAHIIEDNFFIHSPFIQKNLFYLINNPPLDFYVGEQLLQFIFSIAKEKNCSVRFEITDRSTPFYIRFIEENFYFETHQKQKAFIDALLHRHRVSIDQSMIQHHFHPRCHDQVPKRNRKITSYFNYK